MTFAEPEIIGNSDAAAIYRDLDTNFSPAGGAAEEEGEQELPEIKQFDGAELSDI